MSSVCDNSVNTFRATPAICRPSPPSNIIQCVLLYSSTQFLLPACQQEMHDSCQVLPATAVKTIQTPECSLLVITGCVDMVRYTAEQRVFQYKSYVKCGSARKCKKNCHKFPRNTVPSTTDIRELIKEVRSTGSLLDKKPIRKCEVLTRQENR
jgi:hypothetical protein